MKTNHNRKSEQAMKTKPKAGCAVKWNGKWYVVENEHIAGADAVQAIGEDDLVVIPVTEIEDAEEPGDGPFSEKSGVKRQ
jgi:hypothetical protein